MIARSRSHLAAILEGQIRRVSRDGTGDARRSGEAVPVKTYLMEGRGPVPPKAGDHRGPFVTLAEMAADPVLRGMYSTRVHPADDPDLATIEIAQDDERAFVYVDWADSRHWLLHTFAMSRLADRFVSNLAAARRGVGRAALPGEFLENAAALGSTVALTLGQERRVFEPGASRGASDFVKARIWGTRAGRLLSLVRVPGALEEGIALSTIQVKHQPDAGDDSVFCLDDLRWDGRIITRGTSLQAHLELTAALQGCYARQVQRLESLHAVRMNGRDGILHGRSLTLHLTRPIRHLERFCRMVFSSANPFLLWGMPVVRGPDSVSVAAVDLNFGQGLAFEFTPEFIRLFLPRDTSGGTVVRFYTNLQHHLDPRVRLLDQDECEIFQL
ncbi:MAG: hypothetical protein OXI76_04110 [Gemmatimonadota bacterium]|nr:hypothetical protein [Gemmatimonadota bacterium]